MTTVAVLFASLMWKEKFSRLVWFGVIVDAVFALPSVPEALARYWSWLS